MAAHPKRIEIAPGDRPVLEKWANSRVAERRLVDRARMVLRAAEGQSAKEIAELVGCSDETVKRHRSRSSVRVWTGCVIVPSRVARLSMTTRRGRSW